MSHRQRQTAWGVMQHKAAGLRRTGARRARMTAICLALLCAAPLQAQDQSGALSTEAAIEAAVAAAAGLAPEVVIPPEEDATPGSPAEAAVAAPTRRANAKPDCQPGFGCVTNLPLPRYVTLKGDEGNARRGPGLTHRIDWVFTRPGMPLRITAEYENWRRVEDQDGEGGWVHYALLSGVRSVVINLDMAELRASPSEDARVMAQAETGVVAKLLSCTRTWCRIAAGSERGWIEKSAIWGVDPDEQID